ncbi:MAG: VOC family protein, partial [Actinomycetota bacterium]|nr:VOC family protein [Actinomycetota bacterium]
MNLFGLHHVSAIASSREDCIDFYGLLLGLDSVAEAGAGTLAFTADRARPGGVISFQVVPGVPRGTAGRGLVHRLQWAAPGPEALVSWRRRLEGAGVAVTAWLNGAGDPLALRFADPDGLEHELTLGFAGGSRLRLTGVRAYAAASVQSGDLLAGRLGFSSCGEGQWLVGGRGEAAR